MVRGLTSPSFFACQGGTIAAQMNPKEEEVTIITEVSPRGLVCVCTALPSHMLAREEPSSAAGRCRPPAQADGAACATRHQWRRGRAQELQGPLLRALTPFGQLVMDSDTRQFPGTCGDWVPPRGGASVSKELRNEGNNHRLGPVVNSGVPRSPARLAHCALPTAGSDLHAADLPARHLP